LGHALLSNVLSICLFFIVDISENKVFPVGKIAKKQSEGVRSAFSVILPTGLQQNEVNVKIVKINNDYRS